MKTKNKVIIIFLLLGWFILFCGIFYVGHLLSINLTKWYLIPYFITSLGLLISYSLIVVNLYKRRLKTAKEFCVEKFGEPPQTKEEKLAIAIMTEYAEYCFNESKKIITRQSYRCPVCNGNGLVPSGFYNGDIMNGSWLSTDTASETCRSCKGSGVVNF